MHATDCGWGKCVYISHTHSHSHSLPTTSNWRTKERDLFQLWFLSAGNLESVNVLIRKVPTEHTDFPLLLSGSFGAFTWFSNDRLGQSDGTHAQHLASNIIALLLCLNDHISPSTSLIGFSSQSVYNKTSQTGYCSHLNSNKAAAAAGFTVRDPAGQVRTKCSKVSFKRNVLIASYTTTPPPPTCYHNNDSDK